MPYVRVLGLRDGGRAVLRRAQETARLPIVTRPSQIASLSDTARRTFALERAATDLWSLSCPIIQPPSTDYTQKIIYTP